MYVCMDKSICMYVWISLYVCDMYDMYVYMYVICMICISIRIKDTAAFVR
jgi:hypothetical protein